MKNNNYTMGASTRFSRLLICLLFVTGLWTTSSFAQLTFTTSGVYTVPAGVTSITVYAWGGGGGAGGGSPSCSAQGEGSGGGGGGLASSTFTVIPGETYTVTIGAGGTAGAVLGNGGAGGTTTFTGPAGTLTATGGGAGLGGSACGTVAGGAAGAGTVGTTLFSGGAGSAGITTGTTSAGVSGKGGGAAGSAANGTTPNIACPGTIGTGGSGAFPGGNGGVTASCGLGLDAAGQPGIAPGGGGSGGQGWVSSTTPTGGAGARGQVSIVAPCGAPTNPVSALVLTAISPSIIGVSFTAAPGSDSYLTVRYATGAAHNTPVNGTSYSIGGNIGGDGGTVVSTGAATSFNATGLTLSTTYDFYVYSMNSLCSGGPLYFGTFVSGTQTTPAFVSSIALGGLWSSPATWGGAVPAITDNVVISAGSTVTVDQVANVTNLTVSGQLQWNATNTNTLSMSGNVLINAGGKFLPYTTALAGPTVNVAGNFTNNGYVNYAIGFLTFNGTASTLDGTGTFEGDGTRGIIKGFTSFSGNNVINTSTPLTISQQETQTAGSLNTNGLLKFDNTALIFGRPLNIMVANVVVTNMGGGYTVAPIPSCAGSALWVPSVSLAIGNVRTTTTDIYVCSTAGTSGTSAPTHTSGTATATGGTAVFLWVGPAGTIGNPYITTALTVGTQYFYGGNLYTAVLTTAQGIAPPTHVSGVVGSFRYVGTPAQISVNWDAATSTVRSANLLNAGTGYASSTGPAIVIVPNATGSAAAATAVVPYSVAGFSMMLIQKSGEGTVTGGLTINSDQGVNALSADPQNSSGVGALFTTGGGNNYSIAPQVGFSPPTALNLVTNTGSGYTTAPTITVTGGTQPAGATALLSTDFTITVNSGKIVSVYVATTVTKTYITPPTLAFSSGTATLAFPANCFPAATPVIGATGQILSFNITNSGYGYVVAPSCAFGIGSGTLTGGTYTTIATNPSVRIAGYELILNFFAPATTSPAQLDDAYIPASRKMHALFLNGNGNGLILNGNLTLIGSATATNTPPAFGTFPPPPLVLFGSLNTPGNVLDLGGNNLKFSWNGYAGQASTFGASNAFIKNGSMTVIGRGGASTFSFPFSGTFGWFAGSTPTAVTTGSTTTTVTVSDAAAPTGTVSPSGTPIGNRSFRAVANAGSFGASVFGLNPTITMNFNSSDGLASDNDKLFACNGTATTGPWTVRSTAAAAGALVTPGSRTTATVAPGPIAPTGDDYYAWATTGFTPLTPLSFSVAKSNAVNFNSIMPVVQGGDGTGLVYSGIASSDDGVSNVVTIPSSTFQYQGVTVTGFRACTNGYVILQNFFASPTYSTWLNQIGSGTLNNCLAAFWDDLTTNPNTTAQIPSAMRYYISSDPIGSRKITAEWWKMTAFGNLGPELYFQIVLDETDNSIAYNYGNMQLYNGTVNLRYSYSCGLNGAVISAAPKKGEVFAQQFENKNAFDTIATAAANVGVNSLAISPDPHSRIKFTPGVYGGYSIPVPTAPDNDESFNPIPLPALTAFPTNIAWNNTTNSSNFFTTRYATPSVDVSTCDALPNSKDVWFSFVANDPSMQVKIYASGGYIPKLQILDASYLPLSTPQCQLGTIGLTVVANMSGLSPGATYYARVYHNQTGTTATATAILTGTSVSGFTITNPGSNYTVGGTLGVASSSRVTFSGGGGSNASAYINIGAGAVTSITLGAGGNNYTSAPTVSIESPDWGPTGEFGIIVFAKAANDECATAIRLTNLTNSTCVPGTVTAGVCSQNAINGVVTSAATASAEVSCNGIADDDVWYSFDAINTSASITVTGNGGYNPVFEVWDAGVSPGNCGTKTSILCRNLTGAGATESAIVGGLVVGNRYFVRVYDAAAGSGGIGSTFDICINAAVPPCIPAPTTPATGSTVCTGPVTLSWPAAFSATSYDVYFSAGGPPAATLISSAQAGLTFTTGALTSGTYSWRIEPRNTFGASSGCTNFTFSVVAPDVITVSPVPAAARYCVSGSVQLTASGSGNYTWAPALGLDATTGSPVNASPSATTTYTVTGYTTLGCNATASQTITVDAIPTAPTVTGYNQCLGGSTTAQNLTASCLSGVLSGSITIPLTNPSSDEGLCPGINTIATFTLPATPPGVTVIGAHLIINGITQVVTGTFGSEIRLAFNGSGIIGTSPCFQGSTLTTWTGGTTWITGGGGTAADSITLVNLLNPAGGSVNITYSESFNDNTGGPDAAFPATATLQYYFTAPVSTVAWYDASVGGTQVATGSPYNPGINSPAGTYPFYARCVSGTCQSASTQANLIVGAPLVVTPTPVPSGTVCPGSSVTITAGVAGGGLPYSYSWSTGATTTSITVNPLVTTPYTVTVSDGCGNTTTATATINVFPGTAVSVTQSGQICNGIGSIQLTGSGADTYAWTPALGLSSTSISNPVATPVATTTYTVTGTTTATGCTSTASITVISGLSSNVTATATNLSVCAGSTTTLGASVQTNVSYSGSFTTLVTPTLAQCQAWDAFCTALVPASYQSVTISGTFDAIGRTATTPANAQTLANALHNHVTTSVTDGAFVWMVGNTCGSLNGACQGSLPMELSADGTTCTCTTPGYNIRPAIGVNNWGGVNTASCGGPSQTINVTFAVPSGANLYSWSPAAGLSNSTIANPVATVNTTTTYTVTVTNAQGCTSTSSITITVGAPLTVTSTVNNPTICFGSTISLNGTATGGGAPYTSYTWTDGIGGPVVGTGVPLVISPPVGLHNYYLVVTDNCSPQATATSAPGLSVTVNPAPTVTITADESLPLLLCGSGSVHLHGHGATDYVWSPGTGLNTSTVADVIATPITTTTYTVSGTTSGCSSTASITVTYSPAVLLDGVTATPQTGCAPLTSQLQGTFHSNANPAYCLPSYASFDGTDFTDTVKIKDATGATVLWSYNTLFTPLPGYNDQTALPTITLTAGTTYQIYLHDNPGFTENVAVFMDYNTNGTLTDALETILPSTAVPSGGNVTVTFTVPPGAYNGPVRLRTALRFSTAASACNVGGFGVTNDFTMTIAGGVNNPAFVFTYAWSPASNLSSTSIANPVATGLTAGPHVYTVIATNGAGCTATGSVTITPTPCGGGAVVNVKAYFEGYYHSDWGRMDSTLFDLSIPGATNLMCDTVIVELHAATGAPGSGIPALIDSYKAVIGTNGQVTGSCSVAAIGTPYYIAVRHRSAIWTWSTNPVTLAAITNYDFTTAQNQAYQDNQILYGTKWCFYMGDINQDENVALDDFSIWDLDNSNFAFGYNPTDLNGDGNTALDDFSIWDANNANFVFSAHPIF